MIEDLINHRRYKEPLFDILIAGGMLSPGGIVSEVMSKYCVFTCEPNTEAIRENLKVIKNTIQMYISRIKIIILIFSCIAG